MLLTVHHHANQLYFAAMAHFEDPEAGETTANGAKLQRPWTVFILAFLIALAVVGLIYVETSGNRTIDDKYIAYGLSGFTALALILSAAYAYIGARYSLALARRVVGAIGGILLAIGIGLLIWALLSAP